MFAWLMGGCRVLEAYTCDYRAGTNVVGKRAVSLDIEELMSVSVGEYGLPRLPARAHSQLLATIQTEQNTSLALYHISLQSNTIHSLPR